MKSLFIASTIAATLAAASGSASAADVGVSVQINQPGVYGRVDIGRYSQPAVVVARPIVVAAPAFVSRPIEPAYLWVPPGHRKHWRQHCAQYGACGTPVYFVQDGWYRNHVIDDRRERWEHRDDRDHDRDRGRGHGRERGG